MSPAYSLSVFLSSNVALHWPPEFPVPEIPSWLIPEPYTDTDLGPLRSGKEAQISVVERSNEHCSCLLARKHYLPREVKQKGENYQTAKRQ